MAIRVTYQVFNSGAEPVCEVTRKRAAERILASIRRQQGVGESRIVMYHDVAGCGHIVKSREECPSCSRARR
jgi:hypothetical protein